MQNLDKSQSYLKQMCQFRNRVRGKNNIILICGELGSGKSWAGMALCHLLDPSFRKNMKDRIIWNMRDFFTVVRDLNNCYVLVDETNLQGYSQYEWASLEARIFGFLNQSIRFKMINVVMTMPKYQMLSIQSRNLVNFVVNMYRVYRKHKTSVGTVYRFVHDGLFGDWTHKIEFLTFNKPPDDMCIYYEEQRLKFLTESRWDHWEEQIEKKLGIKKPVKIKQPTSSPLDKLSLADTLS